MISTISKVFEEGKVNEQEREAYRAMALSVQDADAALLRLPPELRTEANRKLFLPPQ